MAVVAELTKPEVVTARRPMGALFRSALRLRRTQVGLGLVLLILAIAVFGPRIAPHGPSEFIGTPSATGVPGTLFGTDHIGQDVWSRFLNGGLTILLLAAASTVLGLVLGVVVGLVTAYSRNILDDILMRIMDVILAFPQIMLALVAIATVGPNPLTIILAVGLTTMPRVARVTRGAAQPVVERDFVAAAEAIGVPRVRILLSEIFPNILSPLLVEASLRLTYAIGVIAALAFLGLTINPGAADWGLMIQENRIALTVQPWGVVLPVAAIALLTMGTGLIGDGIARAAAGIDRSRGGDGG
ncbi:MAG TPA: ABC transporter permease [Candidatus Angelobacter sp.]|jgi:peptide/nickel transport system permease protein|nr:ABC transporter permease [Candidatus Angelobacter sp.]